MKWGTRQSWGLGHAVMGAAVLAWVAGCSPSGTDDPLPGTSSSSGQASSSSSGQASSSSSGMASSGGASSSSSGSSTCTGVFCALDCEFGFAPDENGCPVCQCLPDPRTCRELDADSCRAQPRCALVNHDGERQCCERAADGTIDCSGPPPPPACMSDSECRPGQICNTWDYCLPAPGCQQGGACPAVCYGLCQAPSGGCTSDWDCRADQHCAFETPPPCDPAGTACGGSTDGGTCVDVQCPDNIPVCPDGSAPAGWRDIPHGCPVPICGGACEGLTPEQCDSRPDCQGIYAADICACDCDPATGSCPPCLCEEATYQCVPRDGCFSDQDCAAADWCDFSFDDCPDCGRPAMGICRPRGGVCQGLSQDACESTPGCQPVFAEACGGCPPGETCPCQLVYQDCRPRDVTHCSRDAECGPGMRCNLCPALPGCPECDACGPPVCEPQPVERCTTDQDCGPARHCRIEGCTNSIPPSCVGVCEDTPSDCSTLDQVRCSATPGCRPVLDAGCPDGCHDEQGHRTSCGPCLAIACPPANYVRCETDPANTCCTDSECGPNEQCALSDVGVGVGQCLPSDVCGPDVPGRCPPGSECTAVGCNPNGSGTGCAALFACTPVSGCSSDDQCGPGMRCNTCPPDPTCPDCTVCGPPRCESGPTTCDATTACPDGCACSNGACVGPDDGLCPVRPFRICQDDSQCLPDEYCQRCPPGSACFAPDHCAPRQRPGRQCAADSDCLPDEHCAANTGMCELGSPGLRPCSSNLECRPDEYCQICPPNALCLLPDHCEVRGFRPCERDEQCLPDEYCQICPPGSQCFVADHCEVLGFRVCSADSDCNSGEHCEMCPPGALCFVADHCVPD